MPRAFLTVALGVWISEVSDVNDADTDVNNADVRGT